MAIYYNTETGEYPRYFGDLSLLYPNWNDETNPPTPWVVVAETTSPECSLTEKIDIALPTLVDNVWTQQWTVREQTPEEILEVEELLQSVKNLQIES